MAKIQLSMEELLQLVKGEMNTPELKKQLAKSLLDVWQSEEVREEIESRGKELAKKKMERTIEASFKEEATGWGYNKKTTLSGWAIPLIREELSKSTLPMILEAIKPELEKVVSDLVKQEFGSIIMSMMKSQTKNNSL